MIEEDEANEGGPAGIGVEGGFDMRFGEPRLRGTKFDERLNIDDDDDDDDDAVGGTDTLK